MMGTLYIVATPIGHMDDITIRAIKTLFSSNIILCEDTRRSGLFLYELRARYGELYGADTHTDPRLISYYDEVEDKRIPEIIELLMSDTSVSLISDAGTPLISDPGYRLVRECVKRNIPVISIPGPSAILTALTSSGLPPDKFTFMGYAPEKQSARIGLFTHLLSSIDTLKFSQTVIFYCAPHKLIQTLEDMKSTIGDREIVLARELTKVHEEIWRGTISEGLAHFQNPQGEIVLLFTV